jgi:hypothetical protein
MHIDMRQTSSEQDGVARALLSLLEELTTDLVRSTADGDFAWLKPLVVLLAEIEFTAMRPGCRDAATLADECRELGELLTSPPSSGDEFPRRYGCARRALPTLRTIHDGVLVACRVLVSAGESGSEGCHP